MAFNINDTVFNSKPVTGHAGEPLGLNIISSNINFVDGIVEGDIALLNNTTVDITGSIIGGVVKRDLTGASEANGTLTNQFNIVCDVVETGLVTVNTVSGVAPRKFDVVHVKVADSRVLADVANGTPMDAYFYAKVAPNIWSIVINKVGAAI